MLTKKKKKWNTKVATRNQKWSWPMLMAVGFYIIDETETCPVFLIEFPRKYQKKEPTFPFINC